MDGTLTISKRCRTLFEIALLLFVFVHAGTTTANSQPITRLPIMAARSANAVRPSLIATASQDLPAKKHAPVSVPRIHYRMRTLPNGLTIYTIENHKSPTVTIQVSYRVGGKNDPEGKSGFAHLFEHLMFKSTKNMKSEMMDRLTEDVGGNNNAFTADDRTVYYETVPSNYLETLIWAEADRMANLNVDDANFMSERAVVEEEYRQSVLAPPYGRLNEYVTQHSFAVHPYKHGVIGSIPNLDAANLEDVRHFHNVFYRPDNAVLIVSGDFDASKLDAWISRYFGRIPKPAGEIQRVSVHEPPRTAEMRYSENGPNVPLPAVVLNYLVPTARDADGPALNVAGVILSGGRSSRLYQSLVYTQHVAAQASARADLRADAGLFDFTTIAASGKTVDDAEAATLMQIERLKTEPVSAAELEKAKNQLVARALRSRETASGQAFALSEAVIISGDPERVNTDIARLQAVTAADIQRVALKYFTPQNRLVVRYQSGAVEQGGVSSAPTAASTPVPPPVLPTEAPPPPAAPRETVIPKVSEKTLANGLKVVVVAQKGTGLVSVDAVDKVGGANDPADIAGLADFTASLLTRGTGSRSAKQIADEAESLGGSIQSSAAWDSTTVSLSVLSACVSDAMPLFSDVVRNPAFAKEELERLRGEELDDLAVSLRAPGTLARYVASRVIFGDTPYGHDLDGTPESIKTIQSTTITDFYHSAFSPRKTVLVFGGDITPSAAYTLAQRFFGEWTSSDNRPAPATQVSASPGGRVVVVDKPDAGQAAVLLVRSGIRRGDPDYEIARVANAVLGEGFSARLNEEIRIKRGLSYGASSRFDMRRDGGLFVESAQTRNDAVPEVAELLSSELTRLSASEVSTEEMIPRKAALSGNYSRSLETGSGLTGAIASLITYDLPLTSLNSYLPRVQSVTAAQIQAFAARDLSRSEASIVIVGDGRKFLNALRLKFPNTEVIPIANLDLNVGSLKKQ
jgi:zinc protease